MNRIVIAIIGTIWLLGALPVDAAEHKEAKERGRGDVAVTAEEAVRAQDRTEQKERRKTPTRDRQASGDQSDDADAPGRGRGDGPDAAAGERGRQQSEEMRARKEERKTIQEEYRSNREPGQEGQTQREGEAEKKPWWKFWGE